MPLFPTVTIIFPNAIEFKLSEVFEGILTNAVLPTPTAEKIAPSYPTENHLSKVVEYSISDKDEIYELNDLVTLPNTEVSSYLLISVQEDIVVPNPTADTIFPPCPTAIYLFVEPIPIELNVIVFAKPILVSGCTDLASVVIATTPKLPTATIGFEITTDNNDAVVDKPLDIVQFKIGSLL